MKRTIEIKPCADIDELSETPDCVLCSHCSAPAPVRFSNVAEFADQQGNLKYRVRIVAECSFCKKRTTYRLGGYVVKDFRHIHIDDMKEK